MHHERAMRTMREGGSVCVCVMRVGVKEEGGRENRSFFHVVAPPASRPVHTDPGADAE